MDTPIDVLKIFCMQEPALKDLMCKNITILKDSEVVPKRDVILRNSKVENPNLEQQFAKLRSKTRDLDIRWNTQKNIVIEYEQFYSKIMAESAQLMREKQENEIFCKDLMEKYEKSRKAIELYEHMNKTLNNKVLECEGIITSLTEEYAKLKEYIYAKFGDKESKNNRKLSIKNNITKKYSKSMFEPLKGLDK